jgi:hypothetical protein
MSRWDRQSPFVACRPRRGGLTGSNRLRGAGTRACSVESRLDACAARGSEHRQDFRRGWHECPMPLSFDPTNVLHKLWGSQSWLQPAFSRRLRASKALDDSKEPPERRLRAELPAPQLKQNATARKLSGIGHECLCHLCQPSCRFGSSWEFVGRRPIPTDHKRRWSVPQCPVCLC